MSDWPIESKSACWLLTPKEFWVPLGSDSHIGWKGKWFDICCQNCHLLKVSVFLRHFMNLKLACGYTMRKWRCLSRQLLSPPSQFLLGSDALGSDAIDSQVLLIPHHSSLLNSYNLSLQHCHRPTPPLLISQLYNCSWFPFLLTHPLPSSYSLSTRVIFPPSRPCVALCYRIHGSHIA